MEMKIHQAEVVITEAFKEMNPWSKEGKSEKWQNYLNNLCIIHDVPKINLLITNKFPSGISEDFKTIIIDKYNLKELLFIFYLYKNYIKNKEFSNKEAAQYSYTIFFSVWPEKIKSEDLCPKDRYFKDFLIGIVNACGNDPKKRKEINFCNEHLYILEQAFPDCFQYRYSQKNPWYN